MAKTLKVRMLVSMAGPDESYVQGSEYVFPEAQARAFCSVPAEAPRAEPVGWTLEEPKPKRERATRQRRETAAQPSTENR